MNKQLKTIIFEAMIATIYVVLVYAFQFMSFEVIQFRIAEILLILVFFNPKHAIGLSIGTFVANLVFSTLGIFDPIFGTLATMIALVPMYLFRKTPLLAFIFPVISNGLIVAGLLHFILDLPYVESALWVALGETAVLYIAAYPIYRILRKNQHFISLMES